MWSCILYNTNISNVSWIAISITKSFQIEGKPD